MSNETKLDLKVGLCMLVGLVLFTAWLFSGCAARVQTVTNLPAGVTQQQAQSWDTAIANLHKMAVTTTAVRQAVIALNQQPAGIDPKAYGAILVGLGKIDQLQLAAVTLLQQQPQNFSATVKQQVDSDVTQITQELTTLNSAGVTGIKNANSLQTINGLLAEIGAAANLVLQL